MSWTIKLEVLKKQLPPNLYDYFKERFDGLPTDKKNDYIQIWIRKLRNGDY